MKRSCECCEGRGCSECGGTGERHTTHLDAGDGLTMRVHGDKPLSPEMADALRTLARCLIAPPAGDSTATPPRDST